MATEEDINLKARWEYEDAELKRMQVDVVAAANKVRDANDDMVNSFFKGARGVSHLATSLISLEGIISRVESGQLSMGEAALGLIPTFISLASSIWTIVAAEEARAVVSAIASNIMSLGTLTPIILAAAGIGVIISGMIAESRPVRHEGGYIPMSGDYNLLAGEYVLEAGRAPVTNIFHIHIGPGVRGRQAARDFIEELRVGGWQ